MGKLYIHAEGGQRLASDDEILSAAGRIMAARRKGKSTGRRPALDAKQRQRALAMLAKGERQIDVAERLGVSQATISKLARETSDAAHD